MKKLKLDILGENYYLSKEVFKHDLSIAEVRLLLVLSSVSNTTLSDLNYEQKMWIANSKSRYASLKEYEKNLISLGLLNQDGTGLTLVKDFIIYRGTDILDNCKNTRQLFLSSLHLWYKKGNDVIISEELFKTMFGDTIKTINKNWKRTCEQLNIVCSWEKKNNNIYIKQDKVVTETVKEEVVVKTEEQVETKDEIKTENNCSYEKRDIKSSVYMSMMSSVYACGDYIEPPNCNISEKDFEV